mgnify:FL=1
MPEILKLFPTPVYYEENIINVEDNDFIVDCCYKIQKAAKRGGEGWHTKVYNTLDTHDITYDENFKRLNIAVQNHIQKFVKVNGSNRYYNLDNGWINIYKKNDYQEYHYHNDAVFSAVYYARMPENGGGLILNSPKEPDMFPIRDIDEQNEFNHSHYKIYPKERSLVIFRSFVQHMVEPGQHESERISIAYNAS